MMATVNKAPSMSVIIRATGQADALISELVQEHGQLSFHFSGRVGGALVCLPAGELRIGAFDVLMGSFRGAPLYMRTDDAHDWNGRDLLIGVMNGPTRGFSLEAGSGMRFVLHPAPAEGGSACF